MTFASLDDAMDRVRAVLSDDVVSHFRLPTEAARGLPNDAFTSEEFFELEQKTLFRAPGCLPAWRARSPTWVMRGR